MSFDDGVQARALVKWFNVTKGFGFVAPVDGTPDAFLHISVLNRAGLQEISDGTEILCTITQGAKGPQVIRIVEVIGGGTTAPRTSYRDAAGPGARVDSAPESPAPTGPEVEMPGTVKWFKVDKGFGFITTDDGGKDVFIHKSVLRRCHIEQLEAGQRVQMRVQDAPKGREATWILPI
ncbi:MAG: cold shock domain-containing protein [Azospirillaceae bacterium]|nr:cold shock domain-containing protein [Azospirillaceae bacterium]